MYSQMNGIPLDFLLCFSFSSSRFFKFNINVAIQNGCIAFGEEYPSMSVDRNRSMFYQPNSKNIKKKHSEFLFSVTAVFLCRII